MTTLSHEQAELEAGYDLNRGRHYFIHEGILSTKEHCKGPCPDCSCDSFCQCCNAKGPGCEACKGSGRRVERWVRPVSRHSDEVFIRATVKPSDCYTEKYRVSFSR